MTTNWLVLKFGGTSVSGLRQWQTIAELLEQRIADGHHVLLVCSAMSGVTDALSELAAQPESESKRGEILERHQTLSADLNVSEDLWLPKAEADLLRLTQLLIQGAGVEVRAKLLAMGEWLSTRIGAAYLNQSISINWVDATSCLKVADEPDLSLTRQYLSASCHAGVDLELQKDWTGLAPAVITQGFVASTAEGGLALLGRGGSDTSAALFAGRLGASSLEIWTDVPGLFTADPHLIPQARLLSVLGFDEALEMAGGGARVVHPRCIRVAEATDTSILVKDTSRPELQGTLITRNKAKSDAGEFLGIKAITCQKDMLVLLLQNTDTRREVGFLARVFDVFQYHGVSIELVATSETTTTVALNRTLNHLDDVAQQHLVADLETHSHVVEYNNGVCVNLVGNSVKTAMVKLSSSLGFFESQPLLMMSLSANNLCLSLLVEADQHEALLKQLHENLIPSDLEPEHQVFGARWMDLPESK